MRMIDDLREDETMMMINFRVTVFLLPYVILYNSCHFKLVVTSSFTDFHLSQ